MNFKNLLPRSVMELVKDYGGTIVGSGLSRLLALCSSVILARCLGVEEFGRFAVAFTVMMLIAQLLNLLDTSFIKFYVSVPSDDKYPLSAGNLLFKFTGLVAFIS